jgi:hypothetical protein
LSDITADNRPDDIEILLEAARRANWDALHGPRHLRSGRFRPVRDPGDAEVAPAPRPQEPGDDTPHPGAEAHA